MQVALEELRRVTDQLYNHLADQGHKVLEIPDVHYWSIPREQRVNRYEDPNDLTIGQTSEDWERLRRIATGESDAIGYGLTWLASILREIGEQHAG
jgi:hypothetical protein